MAAYTVRRRALKSASDMTLRAFQCGVHAGQSKTGELQVIEFHTEPRVHVMALLACGREASAMT